VNAVEASGRVFLIELKYALDVAQESFAVFAGLIGIGAGEESFDADIGPMKQGD
jgi:hypothetical protein